MVLNPFFQQGSPGEQSLVQSLINEQLKIYGVDVHYMPRKYVSSDSVLREVNASSFEDAYPIEAYIDNFDGFGDNKGAIGYLIGEENRGLNCMFTMMNNARLNVEIGRASCRERV